MYCSSRITTRTKKEEGESKSSMYLEMGKKERKKGIIRVRPSTNGNTNYS